MSETPPNVTDSETNPLLKAWQTPFETPPFDEIKPEHFLPAFEQAFADHSAEIAAITHDPAAPDFANTITALERSGKLLTQGRRRSSTTWSRRIPTRRSWRSTRRSRLRMARHWNPIMMNAVLFGRIAHAAREPRRLGLTARAAAAAGAHLHPLPPRRRRPSTRPQDADGRDQRAARPSRHRLQPSSARRRAGLVHGARRGRPRRACPTASSPPPRPRRKSAAWPARRS